MVIGGRFDEKRCVQAPEPIKVDDSRWLCLYWLVRRPRGTTNRVRFLHKPSRQRERQVCPGRPSKEKEFVRAHAVFRGKLMVIVVEADSEGIIAAVLAKVDDFLSDLSVKKQVSGLRSVDSWDDALKELPDANLALFSTPGEYTAPEIEKALDRGLNVFSFSDNISLEDEVRLKRKAHEKGLVLMVAAPAVTRFVGAGGFEDAVRVSEDGERICVTHNPNWTIPTWDFKGTNLGIDIRKVVATGITPTINTGIAHKKAGIGQVGAGTVQAPLACFEKALEAYCAKLGIE